MHAGGWKDLRYPPLGAIACVRPVIKAAVPDPIRSQCPDSEHSLLKRGQDTSDTGMRYLCLENRYNFD